MREKGSFRRGRLQDTWVDHDEYAIFTTTKRRPNVFSNNNLNQKIEQFDPLNAKKKKKKKTFPSPYTTTQ